MVERGGRQRIPRPPSARAGAPPPWAGLDLGARRLPLATVRAVLAELPAPRRPEDVRPESRAAAVLVPLFEEDGETRVIFEKRPETMPSHQGEIAFPGGKLDPEVDAGLLAAALRETEEEIGLAPDAVEVVAELDGIGTVGSRFTIAPFVGLLDGRPALRPDDHEVVEVFDVALSELMDDGVYHEERWDLWEPDRPVHFYDLPGETVWGATARILTGLLSALVDATRSESA